jgi:hypothetical protein
MYVYDIISLNFYVSEKCVTNSFRENQNTFTINKFFFQKSVLLLIWEKKRGAAGQATDENIIERMRFECRINKTRIQTNS